MFKVLVYMQLLLFLIIVTSKVKYGESILNIMICVVGTSMNICTIMGETLGLSVRILLCPNFTIVKYYLFWCIIYQLYLF